MVKTNILQYYIDAFGEETLIYALTSARNKMDSKSKKIESMISPVTNPIIRFMMRTAIVKNGKLEQVFNFNIKSEDEYIYFQITGKLLHQLQKEIIENPYYLKDLKRGLIGTEIGAALSSLNELISAAYYKHIGKEIVFANADGMPDVDIKDTVFATDAKLFPNGSIRLRAALNESREIIPKVFNGMPKGNLVVSVWTPDKKLLHKALEHLLEHMDSESNEPFKDENISLISTPNHYEAGDISFIFTPQDFRVTFQAVWPLDESVEALKTEVKKSIVQTMRLNKRAITWVLMPYDAEKHAIQAQALRFVAGFHPFVEEQEDLQAVVVYSLAPTRNGNTFGAMVTSDVYGHSSMDLKIDKNLVNDFLLSLLDQVTILI